MSKKKVSSGSTMTLKDFHGGSIPSDIPLPSAPGVVVRPSDRPGYDRQGSWGSSIGRSDHRLRPNSAGSMRTLDDKTPFLTNTANLGRHFDEDERKPLDGGSVPRRVVSDECLGGSQMHVDNRGDSGRLGGYRSQVSPPAQVHAPSVGPYAARVMEGGSVASVPNNGAWGAKKEVVAHPEPAPRSFAGQSNASKLVQASALEKVSSGRWQTRPMHQQADVEVISQPENSLHQGGTDCSRGLISVNEKEYSETMLVRHVERGLSFEEGSGVGFAKERNDEMLRSPVSIVGKERSSGPYPSRGSFADPNGNSGNAESQRAVEASERPKLKLLPRTKPLEATEPLIVDHKLKSDGGHLALGPDEQGNAKHQKASLGGDEAGDRVIERPKLNLKPRTQPLEQPNKINGNERPAVFGGARPREMVLKERGVDDIIDQNPVQTPVSVLERGRNDSPRNETAPVHGHPNAHRRVERAENLASGHRPHKNNERRDHKIETEKPEAQQRKNWRNENWRNAPRDVERHQSLQVQQHQQERPPSPETWRKPVEPPKPEGLRFGKAVSAVELAQAFSKSVSSDPKPTEQFASPRGRAPSRPQAPFSRLTGSTSTQVNGY